MKIMYGLIQNKSARQKKKKIVCLPCLKQYERLMDEKVTFKNFVNY